METTQNIFNAMKNLFPVSKTLAFHLVPVGSTLESIRRNGVIEDATQLKKDYEVLKAAADRVHKRFIEETLSKLHLKYLSDGRYDSIAEYAEAFYGKDETTMAVCADALKATITDAFQAIRYDDKKNMLGALAGELLVKEILAKEELDKDESEALERMKTYTTFMRPYFTIRDRMYDAKKDGFTIPSRIIDENLPTHLKNVPVFRNLPEEETGKLRPLFGRLAASIPWAYEIADVFTVSAAACLNAQSSIDTYNTLIGGIALEDGSRIQGANEIINLYNQAHASEEGFRKIPKLEKLKKQILSDRESPSWLPDAFEKDDQVLQALVETDRELQETIDLHKVTDAVGRMDETAILVKASSLSDLSHSCTGRWDAFETAIKKRLRAENPMKPMEKENRYDERIKYIFKKLGDVSVGYIRESLEKTEGADAPETGFSLVKHLLANICEPLAKAERDYKAMMDFIGSMNTGTGLAQTRRDEKENARTYIKTWLDDLMDARRTAGVFSPGTGNEPLDVDFYDAVVEPLSAFAGHLVPVYNKVRNYLTRKPYSTDKLRLYFGSPTLLGGWDRNKEKDNRGVLLQSGRDKYLAVLANKKLFEDDRAYDPASDLKRLSLKVIPGPFKMLPKVGFSKTGLVSYKPSEEVLAIKNGPKAVKDYTPEEVTAMVDYYKHVLATNPEWADLPFDLKPAGEYTTLNEFFMDIERQGYFMTWKGVSRPFIERAVERGDIYLFKIDGQDMSENHHGKDGNYKAILDEAFSERNAGEGAIRISGGAAIYYREASLPAVVTHPRNVPIPNKNPRSKNRTRTLPYDLIKDRRFTEDRFALHIPVLMQPDADKWGARAVNANVRDIVKAETGMYVLGINRGERNLLSYAVTAPDGRIVEQGHLNVFDNFNYREKLAAAEGERQEARKDWNAIAGIKDIKRGYLSRAVGEIVRLVKKYGCLIALENLDMEFKRGRQQFEKNVYQQFERDLVGRLSMMMDRNDADRTRSALQLASPGDTPEERTRYPQNGIVLFVNPAWITKTDPLTGFANRLNTHYSSVEKTEALLDTFDSFRYIPGERMFALTFNYAKTSPKKETGSDRTWTVYTHGLRNKEDNEKRTIDTVAATAEMAKVFDEAGIPWKDGTELLPLMKGRGAAFCKGFLDALRLTLQNTWWNGEQVLIASCTKDASGRFYDAADAAFAGGPTDPDTNAAWNIARKGHMILGNIRDFVPGETLDREGKKAKGPKMTVTDAEWFAEVQK